MDFFVISDLHGDATAFQELIKHWNQEKEKLVFIGDLGSRGPSSLALMEIAMELVKEGKAIWIRGNHEVMLDEFLYEPQIYKSYLSDFVGGMETMKSFVTRLLNKYTEKELGDLDNLVKIINEEHKELIDFISELPYIHVQDELMFVHAAIDCNVDKINELNKSTLVWGDVNFYEGKKHKFPHTVIFGHMPTQNLGANGGVFVSNCKKKIGIDGGGFLKEKSASVIAIKINSKKVKKAKVYRYYTNENRLEIYKERI